MMHPDCIVRIPLQEPLSKQRLSSDNKVAVYIIIIIVVVIIIFKNVVVQALMDKVNFPGTDIGLGTQWSSTGLSKFNIYLSKFC